MSSKTTPCSEFQPCSLAERTPDQGRGGCGARHRSAPTGGAANGTPLKPRTPSAFSGGIARWPLSMEMDWWGMEAFPRAERAGGTIARASCIGQAVDPFSRLREKVSAKPTDEGRRNSHAPHPNPCMRSFLSRGKFAWCLAPGGASGVRSRPAPARRNLGGAKCRWPDACQGRSRRRRWPKASLYKGLASDDDRRPRSVGRDYAHLSLDLSPLPRA